MISVKPPRLLFMRAMKRIPSLLYTLSNAWVTGKPAKRVFRSLFYFILCIEQFMLIFILCIEQYGCTFVWKLLLDI